MRILIKIRRITGLLIVVLLLIPACKTAQNKEISESLTTDTVKINYNIVFSIPQVLTIADSKFAKKPDNQLVKQFVVFCLADPQLKIMNQPVSEIKTILKHHIRRIIEVADIDGIGIVLSGQSAEIIEHIVAEALLAKPYLLISIIYNNSDNQLAQSLLNNGITDMILPSNIIEINEISGSSEKLSVSGNVKKIKPEDVFGLDISSLFKEGFEDQAIVLNNGSKSLSSDSEGFINFISSGRDTIDLRTQSETIFFSTENWFTPYRYSLISDGTVKRELPWVEFRKMPREITDLPEFEFLFKTEYPATVKINGVRVKQYKTGIFFKKIVLKEGRNRIRASVRMPDSLSVFYEREFIYSKSDRTRPPFPLWIDNGSAEPVNDMELLAEDIVKVSFQGSLGQDGYVTLTPGKTRVKCSRVDFEDYSLYQADLYLNKLSAGKSYRLTAEITASQGSEKFQFELPGGLKIKNIDEFPLIKVINENSRLTYNLGAPRLGGPIRSELAYGVIMKTNGRIGDNYRVRLNTTENGFINKDDIELMPAGGVHPSYFITSMSCGPSSNGDILSIPYLEPVPYEVFPDAEHNRIVITLFGVGTASTWITHMAGRKVIDKVTWQQSDPETYRIIINLKPGSLWGYDIQTDEKRLLFSVRYPPDYDLNNKKSLAGLKIAIEAGHGGLGIGAVGLSGLEEKVINLDLSLRLGKLFKSLGAEVIQVRESDTTMVLLDKRNIAVKSGADILISIHANAGGRGFLSVAGTSTYWNNPFWAPLAENIYNRLLQLDLKEFGVIGSFNYTVTRTTQMPAILVEQAFMSHAEDEEKLADPQFRQQMAAKICSGLIDYLQSRK